jgi:hypothetical protein
MMSNSPLWNMKNFHKLDRVSIGFYLIHDPLILLYTDFISHFKKLLKTTWKFHCRKLTIKYVFYPRFHHYLRNPK